MCARAPAGGHASSTPGSREARPGAHPPPALVRLRAGVGAGREGAPGALASRSAPRVRRAAGGSGCRRAGESACQPLGRSSRWPSLSPAFGAGAVEPAPRVPRWGRSGDGGSEVSEPERERPCGGHGRPSPRPQPGRHRPVGPAGERRPQPRPPATPAPLPSSRRTGPALCSFWEPVRSPPCAALPHTCLPPLPCCWDRSPHPSMRLRVTSRVPKSSAASPAESFLWPLTVPRSSRLLPPPPPPAPGILTLQVPQPPPHPSFSSSPTPGLQLGRHFTSSLHLRLHPTFSFSIPSLPFQVQLSRARHFRSRGP